MYLLDKLIGDSSVTPALSRHLLEAWQLSLGISEVDESSTFIPEMMKVQCDEDR